MPGICGIFDRHLGAELAPRMDLMLADLRHHAWYSGDQFVDATAGVALGRVTLGYVNSAPQPATNEAQSLLCVMHGELYDAEIARDQLRSAGFRFASDSHAEILLHGFEHAGQKFFRSLHGSFAAILWDTRRRQATIITDRFGMRPLYSARLPGRLLVASSIWSLTLDPEVARSPNWRGVAQFFSFGQYLGNDTSLAGVEIVPAAAWVTYDVDADRLTSDCYYQLSDDVAPLVSRPSELLGQLDSTFHDAVERRLQDNEHLGLALSGGLDARMILALAAHKREQLKTISYGIEGSLDHRCAARMAEIVGCQHLNHMLDAGFLANYRQHMEGMVELTGGQYLSQCIVMPTLPIYRQLGIEVLLRGHAGELMHMRKAYAYSVDDAALAIRTDEQLEGWLFQHLQGHMLREVDAPLFKAPHQQDIARLALDSLRDALRPAAAIVPPLQRLWHIFVTQRLRRETMLSLAKFGSVVEVRVPYLDNDLVRLLLAAPVDMKLAETIQSHILQNRMPAFLDIVNSNTGTRVGANELARKFSTLRMRVLAKLGVKGYQPYERLGLWLRRELTPMIEDILLDERTLDESIFDPNTVRRVYQQHLHKQRNHTYLLMAMMIYELGRRRTLAGPTLGGGNSAQRSTSSPVA